MEDFILVLDRGGSSDLKRVNPRSLFLQRDRERVFDLFIKIRETIDRASVRATTGIERRVVVLACPAVALAKKDA